jgi:hypothetical protein
MLSFLSFSERRSFWHCVAVFHCIVQWLGAAVDSHAVPANMKLAQVVMFMLLGLTGCNLECTNCSCPVVVAARICIWLLTHTGVLLFMLLSVVQLAGHI